MSRKRLEIADFMYGKRDEAELAKASGAAAWAPA
jgi:hypothetical protein